MAGRSSRENPALIVGKGDGGGKLDQGSDDDDRESAAYEPQASTDRYWCARGKAEAICTYRLRAWKWASWQKNGEEREMDG